MRQSHRLVRKFYGGYLKYDRGELDWACKDFQDTFGTGTQHISFPTECNSAYQPIPLTASHGGCWVQLDGEDKPMFTTLSNVLKLAKANKISHFFPPRTGAWISVDELKQS